MKKTDFTTLREAEKFAKKNQIELRQRELFIISQIKVNHS